MRIAQYCFAVLLVFAALVQLNDPDPARWIGIYAAAAAVSLGGARRFASPRALRAAAAVVGIAALLWAAGIWTGANHPLVPWQMFEQWEMKDVAVEETREIFGLLIVAAWMAATALHSSV